MVLSEQPVPVSNWRVSSEDVKASISKTEHNRFSYYTIQVQMYSNRMGSYACDKFWSNDDIKNGSITEFILNWIAFLAAMTIELPKALPGLLNWHESDAGPAARSQPVLPLYPATLASAPTVMNGHCCGHTLFERTKKRRCHLGGGRRADMWGRPVHVWQQKSAWRAVWSTIRGCRRKATTSIYRGEATTSTAYSLRLKIKVFLELKISSK